MARELKPKTRNAGTMTEATFFSWLRSGLRRLFMYWKPAMLALDRAKRPYKGPNKLQKWEYQCAQCRKWFKRTEVERDHIIPCGSLSSLGDVARFLERLSVEEDGFQVLCKTKCHLAKSLSERK